MSAYTSDDDTDPTQMRAMMIHDKMMMIDDDDVDPS